MLIHPIPPLFDENSTVLVLGSFPSVKSRETGFFYGHPQNRFWKVLSRLYDETTPVSIEEKKSFLLRNHIAVWDVISSCDIIGSSDTSIKNVTTNDLSTILNKAPINAIFVNGKSAYKYYLKYIEPEIKLKAVCLPSTSPANAAWSLDRLTEAWALVKQAQNSIPMSERDCS